jgi:3-phosphoglycerate kinase/phosphohistidine swiveling domain-containing protein
MTPVPPRFNTWEAILGQLEILRQSKNEEERIDLLIELLVQLRLIGQDPCIVDQRTKKSDIETLYNGIESATREMLAAVENPSDRFIYYAREVIKKLPVRQGAEEMIERIRAEAEAFEENRAEDDPIRGFAGDLRKEVHRRLSPRIIKTFLEPYIQLAVHNDPAPIVRAGYVALPSVFSRENEDPYFIDLATDLLERLNYLWDYESGDLAGVKRQLADNMDLFERCFLKAEVEGFIELLTPENLEKTHLIVDHLKRLASFKHYLKESFFEKRIELYDLLLLDLSIGRLIFLLANDITNNHFAQITPRNVRDALAVIHELLNISSIKGLAIHDVERLQSELDTLVHASAYDFIRTKRCLVAIGAELQRYLQSDIIDAMSDTLNKALEIYSVPTSRLSQIKTRFFNNFIRRTQIHVLSEFTEKTVVAVNQELERQRDERQLNASFDSAMPDSESRVESPMVLSHLVATTWGTVYRKAREYFGGKGNSILDMAKLGLRVPPAFILGYPLFSRYGSSGRLEKVLEDVIFLHVAELEEHTERRLGDPDRPLLVSVRSGAPTSMPGVMATILNVGLVPEVRSALRKRRDPNLIEILYRRFLENCISALLLRPAQGQKEETWAASHVLTASSTPTSQAALEDHLIDILGHRFLEDAEFQLLQCIRLVYESRGSLAVKAYSQSLATDIRAETAVTVQRLVFGNLNERSLSGVLITRNPITGADEMFGEFKRQAQGEEVVMGSASTEPISALDSHLHQALERCKKTLIRHYRQDLDIEFTVEDGTLYLLQARSARLGAFAQLVADTDFLSHGLLDLVQYKDRLDRLEMSYASVALPREDFGARLWNPPIARGVPINGGVVSGTLVLTIERLKEAELRRESVVFFAHTTKPTDFSIMNGAHAIVTVYPGRTSHAAITAMAMNKPCIVGCADVYIDYGRRLVVFSGAGDIVVHEGERITIDGNTGAVYRGLAPISEIFMPLSSINAAIERSTSPELAVEIVRGLIQSKKAFVDKEMSLKRRSLQNSDDIFGRRVLVRIDANIDLSATSPRLIDAGRRRVAQTVPTLKMLLARGATPIVCSHLGDPGASLDSQMSREKIFSDYCLAPFAQELAKHLGNMLVYHDTSIGASGVLIPKHEIVPGKVNLLENLRFATGEKDNDDTFARYLADLSDGWFVNDAFNVCLRRHASITGVPKFVEHRLAGPLVAKELAALERLLEAPHRPFIAVFCGKEIEAQFGVMAAMLQRVDRLAIIVNPASNGSQESGNEYSPGLLGESMKAAESMIGNFMEAFPDKVLVIPMESGSLEGLGADLEGAGTILWSGPAGLDEKNLAGIAYDVDGEYRAPIHQAFHRALGKTRFAVVCSEEEKQFSDLAGPSLHLSKGPRAFLEYLERLSLPGITALDGS